MTISSALTHAEAERLGARIAELEHERKHLLAVIEILKEISGSLHFIDILQSIARKLGESFGLDRCSIFLSERGGTHVRLVASYEDPTIRNHLVDLERYPELKRAIHHGETVFIPDAINDLSLKHVKTELSNRRVKSITVVPINWRGVAIGAIFKLIGWAIGVFAYLVGLGALFLTRFGGRGAVPAAAVTPVHQPE